MDESCLTCENAKWDPRKLRGLTYGKCEAEGSLATYKGRIAALMPYDNCPKWKEKK